MAKSRQSVDFQVSNPPLMVTDPDRAAAAERGEITVHEYPKHLAKPDFSKGGGGHQNRAIQIATDAKHEKALRAQGYMSHHEADVAERKGAEADVAERKGAEVDEPAPAKAKPGRKPRNPKPPDPAAE